MESVYLFKDDQLSNVEKLLKNDLFMRISYTIKAQPKGYSLYVEASEEMPELDKKLRAMGIEKADEEYAIAIIGSIKQQEENAASGIGLMFE